MVLEELVLEKYDPNSQRSKDNAILNAKVGGHQRGVACVDTQYHNFGLF